MCLGVFPSSPERSRQRGSAGAWERGSAGARERGSAGTLLRAKGLGNVQAPAPMRGGPVEDMP
eukprot:11772960-Heterocapsa_arctica.AAC.1